MRAKETQSISSKMHMRIEDSSRLFLARSASVVLCYESTFLARKFLGFIGKLWQHRSSIRKKVTMQRKEKPLYVSEDMSQYIRYFWHT